MRREQHRALSRLGQVDDHLQELPPRQRGLGWPAGSSSTSKFRLVRDGRQDCELLQLAHRKISHAVAAVEGEIGNWNRAARLTFQVS